MFRRRNKLTTLCLAAALALSHGAAAGMPAVAAQGDVPSLAPMLERVLPGVVSIAVHGRISIEDNPLLSDPFFRRFFGLPEQVQPEEREFQSAGSGVVVDPQRGYVITNNHVIEKADEITVTLSSGLSLRAKKVGTDPATDIAVIQIPAEKLSGVPLGDSDRLKVGDYVVAVGNPFGLQQTVTSGIVSALGRTGLGIEGYENFIQTDASINPGNSGGALVNLKGELVGINSAIVAPSGGNVGIGFAIPINMARQVMAQLIAHGEVRRGQLGVRIQDLTPDLAKALGIGTRTGALVAHVTPRSPADRAGIEAGDVITGVNGERVRSAAELRNRIGLLPIGAKVVVDLLRKGVHHEVTAILIEAVPEKLEVSADTPALAGTVFGAIEPGTPMYGQIDGAVVLEIKKGSRAAKAGLRAGDIVISIGRQPVRTPDDVVRLAREAKDELLLRVVRGGSPLFIVIS